MEEGLSALHQLKLLEDTLYNFFDSSRIADEVRSHLKASWWDITHSDHD